MKTMVLIFRLRSFQRFFKRKESLPFTSRSYFNLTSRSDILLSNIEIPSSLFSFFSKMVPVPSPSSLYYMFIIFKKKYVLNNLLKPMWDILLGSVHTVVNRSADVPAPLEFAA